MLQRTLGSATKSSRFEAKKPRMERTLAVDRRLAGRSAGFLLKYAHRDNAGFGLALMYFRDKGATAGPR